MEQWKQYKLSDICDLIAGFAFKSVDFGTEGAFVVKIKDIQPPFVNLDDADKVNLTAYDTAKLKKFLISKGDFLLAMTGATIGKIGKYISNEQSYLNQRVLKFLPKQQVDSKFIYYSLLTNAFRLYILNHIDSDSAQPNISANTIGKYELSIPCIETQKRIADILSSLDDKIELNRRINDNLEQQAQLLFDDLMAFSDWSQTQPLCELSDINPTRKLSKGEKASFVEMANMPTSGSFPAKIDFKEYNGGMKFKNGDTIMARITPCLENGKAAYVNFLPEGKIGFGSTEYIVLSPKETISSSFLYFLVRNKEFVDYAVKNMNGSSGRQRVSGETIGNYQLPILDRDKLSIFIKVADSVLSKIRQNSFENINLTTQRDLLLPKLMSGELNINDLNC